MFERILWCLFGTFAFWCVLLYLTSQQTPEGIDITNRAFFADTVVAFTVLAASMGVFVLPLFLIRALHARPLPTDDEAALIKIDQECEHWQPTTVGYLENLKGQFGQIEERVRYLRTCELQVSHLYKEAPGAVALWMVERGLSILRKRCWKESGTATNLRQAIERIYTGDVDFEIRNLREEICQIQVKRGNTDSESLKRDYDKNIRFYQRQIDELEQWRVKVSATNALVTPAQSPHEAAWRSFVDIANRTAAAPIIEARSRVEAAMTAIEAKRHYERLVSEQWRRGVLTEEEANYIRQRIREEFLGVKTSIYE